MKKFQEGKKYVFVAKKVKRRCNNQQWKFSKICANEINEREVECLINDYEAFID